MTDVLEFPPAQEAAPDVRVHDVDANTLHLLIKELLDAPVICFDLETQSDREPNEDWHPHSRIVSASFSVNGDEGWVVPCSHPIFGTRFGGDWRDVLRRLFEACLHAKLVGHNLKYDVRWAYSMTGVDLNDRQWFDTMNAAHLLDENAPKDLGSCGEMYLGIDSWKKTVDLKNAEGVPWADLALYNARDTAHNFALVEPMKAELRATPSLGRLFQHLMMPASRALVRVERNGMTLDVEGLRARHDELERTIDEITWDLWNTYVPDALKEEYSDPTVRHWLDDEGQYHVAVPGLMPTWSPQGNFFHALMKALEVPVIERSQKTGKPSWAAGVMKRLMLEGDFPFVERDQERRHLEKELTSFVRPWLEMMSGDGRLFPTFKPANVTTGRLSASSPNPQQINKGLKRYFPSPEGWHVVQADYSQVEMRVAAEIGKVTSMLRSFQEGKDLHRITAASITGKQPHLVTKEERQKGKVAGFGFLYGMGAPAFKDYAFEQYDVAFTYEEAQKTRKAFFDTWPELSGWHEHQRRLVRTEGEVRSPLGRRRRLPDIWLEGFAAAMAERQAINAPVQSMASDLMLLAIITLDRELDPDDALIVCTVHDSVVLYVRHGRVKKVAGQIARAMLYPPIAHLFGARPLEVPLEVEMEIGSAWGEVEKTVVVRS